MSDLPVNQIICGDCVEDIARALLPINCFYNYEITKDGMCHCSDCMMNEVPDLKEKIQKIGCGCFRMPEVQKKAEIEARRLETSLEIS